MATDVLRILENVHILKRKELDTCRQAQAKSPYMKYALLIVKIAKIILIDAAMTWKREVEENSFPCNRQSLGKHTHTHTQP